MAGPGAGPFHEPVDAYSTLVRPVLATADIRFAQAERLYSERGSLQGEHGEGIPDAAENVNLARQIGDRLSTSSRRAANQGIPNYQSPLIH